jgi:hypothetical protein
MVPMMNQCAPQSTKQQSCGTDDESIHTTINKEVNERIMAPMMNQYAPQSTKQQSCGANDELTHTTINKEVNESIMAPTTNQYAPQQSTKQQSFGMVILQLHCVQKNERGAFIANQTATISISK